jgi:tRNA (guanosine-2'-O-)-methyltransferase
VDHVRHPDSSRSFHAKDRGGPTPPRPKGRPIARDVRPGVESYKTPDPVRRDDPSLRPVEGPQALPAPAAVIIQALQPLVTPKRFDRFQKVIAQRTRSVVPVLEGFADPHNMSAVLRSADAFGLQELHVVETEQAFVASRNVAKGAERWLDVHKHKQPEACIEALKERGYKILVASMAGELRPEAIRKRKRVALVFGNEHHGASEYMKSQADGTFAIPMVGFVESLNVSVATAIALYESRGDREGGPLPHEVGAGRRARDPRAPRAGRRGRPGLRRTLSSAFAGNIRVRGARCIPCRPPVASRRNSRSESTTG